MTEPFTDPRIERARELYVDSKVSVRAIARSIEAPTSTVVNWVKRYDWPRRKPKPPANDADASLTTDEQVGDEQVGGEQVGDERAGNATAPAPTSPDRKPRGAKAPAAKPTRRALHKRKRPKVSAIVDRLYRVLTHNLEIMETRMSQDDGTPANEKPERDLRTIGTMVRSVEKLNDLETEQSKRTGSAPTVAGIVTPDEEDRIRRKVIEHILRLRERKRRDGDSGQP